MADLCADGIEFRTELGMIQISSECHPAGLPGISEPVDPDLDLFAILPEPRVTQPGIGGLDPAVVVGVLPIRTSQREPCRIRRSHRRADGGFDLPGDRRELPSYGSKFDRDVLERERVVLVGHYPRRERNPKIGVADGHRVTNFDGF